MSLVCLHDRARLAAWLRRDPSLHAYALGDCDPFFWPHTQWFGWQVRSRLREVVLLYTGEDPPVAHALTRSTAEMSALLPALLPVLPARVFLHLSPGLRPALAPAYTFHAVEPHAKMVLRDISLLAHISTSDVVPLTPADAEAALLFFNTYSPGHWFQVRMLETEQYFGVRHSGAWVAVAGVHVYSARQRVAALGNVLTHPHFRGQGLATRTCAALCRSLRQTTDTIGLNVRADNVPALACYRALGFAPVADYEEMTAVRR